jgi:hypothetical protein
MDFLRWMVSDMMMDVVTWVTVAGVLGCWALGVLNIIKYGWSPKEEAE